MKRLLFLVLIIKMEIYDMFNETKPMRMQTGHDNDRHRFRKYVVIVVDIFSNRMLPSKSTSLEVHLFQERSTVTRFLINSSWQRTLFLQ